MYYFIIFFLTLLLLLRVKTMFNQGEVCTASEAWRSLIPLSNYKSSSCKPS